MVNSYITLDGYKYIVKQGTYTRDWKRQFSTDMAANLVRINYIDRGPGYLYYTLTLQLANWDPGSIGYKAGITQTVEQQMANLEASYSKISTALTYLDPFGNPPTSFGEGGTGVYFTNLVQSFPNYSTSEKVYLEVQIELTESVGITIQ